MSLVTKKRNNKDYLYDQSSLDGHMKATYLGPEGDPRTDEKVKAFGEEAAKRKDEKKKAKKGAKVFKEVPILSTAEDAMDKAFVPAGTDNKQAPIKVPTKTWGDLPAREHQQARKFDLVGKRMNEGLRRNCIKTILIGGSFSLPTTFQLSFIVFGLNPFALCMSV